MSLYFDHVVLNVEDLEQATNDFRSAGFTVIPGGVHKGGLSKNALIFFGDDSFIELFAPTKGWKVGLLKILKKTKFFKSYQYSKKWGLAYRFYSRAMELKPGVADICFLSDDYSTDYSRINDEGIFLTKTLKAARKKPGAGLAKWEMASPFINELPFFRSPYTPVTDLGKKDTEHQNGITGINKVTIVVLDYKDMISKYSLFFNQTPKQVSDESGAKTVFSFKNTVVEIVKASDFKTLQEQLRGKGIGMYGLSFDFKDKEREIPSEQLHGLSIIP